ncbi:MAG TPA: cobyrinate a,c-diamide synthase, partial [Mycobacterium sp.]|nr:cobyrinate a,c-diamide synthase [Mycobacterium sp.]
RTAVTFADSYQPAWVFRGREMAAVCDGAVHGGVHASYLHTHPAANPRAMSRFVEAAGTSKLAE